MIEKKFVKVFRKAKIIQLCIVSALEIFFFIILFCNSSLSKQLYSNRTLMILCACFWVLAVFTLLCLLCDFFHLRRLAEENHALNKAAYLDDLTGIPNRHGLDLIFQRYDTPESLSATGCFMITISNLKEINNVLGHRAGDKLIQNFCSIFEKTGDSFGVLGRNNGNEFVLIINNCSEERMNQFIQNLEGQLDVYNKENVNAPILTKHAYVLNTEEHSDTFIQLLKATYNKLHA